MRPQGVAGSPEGPGQRSREGRRSASPPIGWSSPRGRGFVRDASPQREAPAGTPRAPGVAQALRERAESLAACVGIAGSVMSHRGGDGHAPGDRGSLSARAHRVARDLDTASMLIDEVAKRDEAAGRRAVRGLSPPAFPPDLGPVSPASGPGLSTARTVRHGDAHAERAEPPATLGPALPPNAHLRVGPAASWEKGGDGGAAYLYSSAPRPSLGAAWRAAPPVKAKVYLEDASHLPLDDFDAIEAACGVGASLELHAAPMTHVTVESVSEVLAERALLRVVAHATRRSPPGSLLMLRWYCRADEAAVSSLEERWSAAAAAVQKVVSLGKVAVKRTASGKCLDVVLAAPGARASPEWGLAAMPMAAALMMVHARYGHADGATYTLITEAQKRLVTGHHEQALTTLQDTGRAHVLAITTSGGLQGVGGDDHDGRDVLLAVVGHRWAVRDTKALVEDWLAVERENVSTAAPPPAVTMR